MNGKLEIGLKFE